MLILYHDFPSAASLVAVLRLQRLADEGLPVAFRGFDVLGVDHSLPATLDDLTDWEQHRDEARELGWDLPRPRRHPPTLQAHLISEEARAAGLDAAWRLAAYRSQWLEDGDLGDPHHLATLAATVGLDQGPVRARLDDRMQRLELRQQMLLRRGEGVGGVPVLDANGTFVSPALPDDDLRTLATL